jgi:hypothetical protein
VGFDYDMVKKCVFAACIANAGKMTLPDPPSQSPDLNQVGTTRPGVLWSDLLRITPVSAQYGIESTNVPAFLASRSFDAGKATILCYSRWEVGEPGEIHFGMNDATVGPGGQVQRADEVHVRVRQEYPLWMPMHRAYYGTDQVDLRGESALENHYPRYLR